MCVQTSFLFTAEYYSALRGEHTLFTRHLLVKDLGVLPLCGYLE